jgi:Mn2+/Fe2+ NRAMP family transporter
LGATVMPHSLFLHSSIIQTHAYPWTKEERKMALRYGGLDCFFCECSNFDPCSSSVLL